MRLPPRTVERSRTKADTERSSSPFPPSPCFIKTRLGPWAQLPMVCPQSGEVETENGFIETATSPPKSWIGLSCRLEVRFWEAACHPPAAPSFVSDCSRVIGYSELMVQARTGGWSFFRLWKT